ncbi:hypothetical protein SmJEL517_g01827 [Synchytrium microbalum]|uniref:NAD(P)-binding protein n=1 Tax=Synchytrium microbalum TaxID=1806994 RepID=A0A507CD95_9FUNG|nr:uncharacterized protein SmJEL517_g01827 [Synchytrium microbalum]TPX35894.1 hypothetical protein SmJEL517_g01827 [Synchytrium microbalum]
MSHNVVIAGASRGIGLALVKYTLLQNDKAHVAAGVRTPSKATDLAELAKKYPGRLHIFTLDVDSDDSIKAFTSSITAAFPDGVDVLINNAGILPTPKATLADVPRKDFLDNFNTNALSSYYVTVALLPLLSKSGNAKVLNISSLMGSIGATHDTLGYGPNPEYRASKAAMNMLSATLAAVHPDVTIVTSHPGLVLTDMSASIGVNAEDFPIAITTEVSATSLLKVINGLTKADSGKFLSYDGTTLPW